MAPGEAEAALTGFAPIEGPDARVLVLGTAPSRESLRLRQYYGHPRNLFWPVMGELLGFDAGLAYDERCRQLVRCGVAVWDVARSCLRELSADQTIRDVAPNEFGEFLDAHAQLRAVFLNGKKAEQLFRRLVVPGLGPRAGDLHLEGLPSTSPAHAAMSRADKVQRWGVIRDWVR